MPSNDSFCRMYEVWKRDSLILFENRYAYSIFSVTPSTPGHALVIPKEHVEQLWELQGIALEDFVRAIPETRRAIVELYQEPERIVRFYRSLKERPPLEESKPQAETMLQDPNLRIVPDEIAMNLGINVGEYAGQTVDHFHLHLVPRRRKGQGFATAMRLMLSNS